MKFRVVPLVASLLVFWHATLAPAATNVYNLNYTLAPVANPLKGFLPYQNDDVGTFPCSMEWNYIPLRSLMSGLNSFNWSAIDNLLNDVKSRGHQTVFRVYLDYPTLTTGTPQFLFNEGLTWNDYTDYGNTDCDSYNSNDISSCSGSVSPDYANADLDQALTNFIAAFGARYDGDSRIGFITIGLLGYWGEWHTYPETQWFASTAVQQQVLAAYQAAFTHTKLQVRNPNITTAAYPIGFHDDSFCYDTLTNLDEGGFYAGEQSVALTGIWQSQAIGGEVYPNIQSCLFENSCVGDGYEDFTDCVTTVHATWLLNQGAFSPGYSGSQLTSATAGAHLLGYEFYVPSATLVDAQLSGPFTMSLQITNTGVAPFYYNWPVELRVLNSSDQTVATWTNGWQLSTLLPGATSLTYTQADHGLALGQYKLLLGVPNPMSGGPVLSFANTEMNADQSGWLTLGTFNVVANSGGTTNAAPTLSLASNNVVVLENAGAVTVPNFALMTATNGLSIANVAILSESNATLFATGPAISTSGTLTFTPATTSNGVASVTVQAQDNGGTANGRTNGSTAQTFTIMVLPVNQPPTLNFASNNVVVTENTGAATVAGFALMTTGPANQAGESITNVAILNNSDAALFAAGPAISTGGTLTFTPTAGSYGVASVTAQAQDNGGTANGGTNGSTAQTFTITVVSTNAPGTNVLLTVDPTQTWTAALNVYTVGDAYLTYSPSFTSIAFDPAIFVPTQNASATRLLLGINTNTYDATTPSPFSSPPDTANYFDNADGTPNKHLETDSYVDTGVVAADGGKTAVFSGTVESNTLPAGWTAYAVIKEYSSGYGTFLPAVTQALPASGAFTVQRPIQTNYGLQYGFYVYGPNTAPGSAASQQWVSLIIGNAVTPPNAVTITATVNGNTVTLSFPTQNGHTYTVQYSPTLPATTWTTLTSTNGTGSVAMPTDAISSASTRYYRVSAQ